MDFRPLTGQLFGLGVNAGTARLYTINKTTAVATQVGTGTFSVSGTQFGFDFDPTVDHIRVITNTGQNLRINPNNAAVTIDGNINTATTQADAAAYTNNFAGATSTTQYDIDLVNDSLYTQNPNTGTTTLVGSLGGAFNSLSGFDIRSSDGAAFAALIPGSTSNLYSINLSTGQATFLADLGGRALRAMAIDVANAGQANVISGNDVGVHIADGSGNSVRGNFIGTGANGTSDVGNLEAGVYIHEPTSFGNAVGGAGDGDGNTIRFNGDGTLIPTLAGEGGIVIYFGATGNPILRNSITENTGLGIDLDSSATPAIGADGVTPNDPNDVDSGDANNLQNYPVLAMASTNTMTTVTGTLNSTPSRTFRVEFFSDTAADPSGNGEGRTFVGAQNVTTNASGNAIINFTTTTPVPNGNIVTATATDLTTSDTSEFSAAVTASSGVGVGFEADVSPRPNGDTFIDADDIQQIRLFSVGIGLPYQSNEFQRADNSPRSSSGDGFVDADDVEQARRYAVGTDLKQPAGGPTTESGSSQSNGASFNGSKRSIGVINNLLAPPALRVENASSAAGQQVVVNIRADTAGNEAGYTFSLMYDNTKLTNPVVGTASADGGNVVANTMTAGQIGFSVTSFSGGTIDAGTNQLLVSITFTVVAGTAAGTTPVTFTDTPSRRKASGTDPNMPIPQPSYTPGMVTITAGPTAASVVVAGRVVTQTGRGIRNVIITMTDSNGNTRTATTSSFGYYRFADVAAGESYTFEVRAKRYRFTESAQVRNITQDIDDVIFVADNF